MQRLFRDRAEAGQQLAARLQRFADQPGLIVLGLPRGGVPVAAEVAKAFGAPLDVFIVRKLGVPGHRELAMGAIASGGIRVLNTEVIEMLGISERSIAAVVAEETAEMERREREYRGARPFPDHRRRGAALPVLQFQGRQRRARRLVSPLRRPRDEGRALLLVVRA